MTPRFSCIWLNAVLAHTRTAPQMVIAPAARDSSLPPPLRLRTPALPPYASPGINQRAREAFDLWRAPASSSEHWCTPGSYERAQTASAGEGARECSPCQAPHLPPLLMLCTPGPGLDPALVPSLPFPLLPRHKNRPGWQLRRSKDAGSKEMTQAKITQTALGSYGRGDGSSTGGTSPMHTDAAVLPSRENEIKALYGSVLI